MELDQPSAERRIREFEMDKRRGSSGDAKDAPKRKLEEGNCNFMVLGWFYVKLELYEKLWNCKFDAYK
jgi:hypothetical protein